MLQYEKPEEQILSPQEAMQIIKAELTRLHKENRYLRLKNDDLLIEISKLEKKLREINGA